MTTINPTHYKSANGIEVIDVVDGFALCANLAKAVEYILRADRKGQPIEDLEKALAYVEREVAKRRHKEATGEALLPLGRGFRDVARIDQHLSGALAAAKLMRARITALEADAEKRKARPRRAKRGGKR